jgi:signal transduction histidine kinase
MKHPAIHIFFGALGLLGIYLSSLYSYLLFHSLVEIFSIIVACGIFMVAWNSRSLQDNNCLLFLGLAYLIVAGLDLVHTLSYKGMGIFESYGANLATQLWIAGRSTESVSLLIAPLFLRRKLHPYWAATAFAAIFAVLLAMIFYWDIFPDCFVDGVGLTPFKIYSEYAICLIFAASALILYWNRNFFDPKILLLLITAIAVSICSELAFTRYISVYGFSNQLGHFLKIISFYLIYKAIIETGLVRPYSLLFRDLKQSQEELKKSHEELETRVRERTAQLERSNAELRELTYVASHDLQEPLRKIQVMGSRLLHKLEGTIDEHSRDYLQRMQRSASRMQALIDAMLTYSRLTTEKRGFSRVPLDEVVRDAVSRLQKTLDETGGRVHVEALPELVVEPSTLREMFVHLMGNALKFRREDTEPFVKVYSGPVLDGKAQIFVEDNGIGFEPRYLDRIFAPFQRLHDLSRYGGIGIGLTICRKIIESHGGTITARSTPGQGSTFIVTLPA